MKLPKLSELHGLTPVQCKDAGMAAAKFVTSLREVAGCFFAPDGSPVAIDRIVRATAYQDCMLSKWASSLLTPLDYAPTLAELTDADVTNLKSERELAIEAAIAAARAKEELA